MNEEEQKIIELDIEAKYVDKTEKEFLSRLTYAECLYILTPENAYCDKIIKLSVLKICEIIEKLQKENEELKYKIKGQECVIETQVHNEEVYESIFEKLEKENKELKKQVKSDVNTIF